MKGTICAVGFSELHQEIYHGRDENGVIHTLFRDGFAERLGLEACKSNLARAEHWRREHRGKAGNMKDGRGMQIYAAFAITHPVIEIVHVGKNIGMRHQHALGPGVQRIWTLPYRPSAPRVVFYCSCPDELTSARAALRLKRQASREFMRLRVVHRLAVARLSRGYAALRRGASLSPAPKFRQPLSSTGAGKRLPGMFSNGCGQEAVACRVLGSKVRHLAPNHLAPNHLAPNHLAPNHVASGIPVVASPEHGPAKLRRGIMVRAARRQPWNTGNSTCRKLASHS
jgi:hypothetical protein